MAESKYGNFASRLFRRSNKVSTHYFNASQKRINNGNDSTESREDLPGEGSRSSKTRQRSDSLLAAKTSSTASSSRGQEPNRRQRSATFASVPSNEHSPSISPHQLSPFRPCSWRASMGQSKMKKKAPEKLFLAVVVFEEWLHELASLALEHSLAGEEHFSNDTLTDPSFSSR